MRIFEKETAIDKFAKDHIDFLLEGDYDGLSWRVNKFLDGHEGTWTNEVYEALLKEAIEVGEVGHLYFLCDRMVGIPVLRALDMDTLRDVDVPVIEEWYETELEDTESPFFTTDEEQLKIIMDCGYDNSSKKIAWEDGEKLYFMEATPVAVALATGEISVLESFLKKTGWKGFYNDEDLIEGTFNRLPEEKKVQMAELFLDDIIAVSKCRVSSPEEAALLSGNLEVIKTVFEAQEEEKLLKRLSSKAIEIEGRFYFREEGNICLPDALYWLNEEESRYIDENYLLMHEFYQLDKILESANAVLLSSYLEEREVMKNSIVEDLIRQIKNVSLKKLTFGMLEEKVKLTGIHCIPISEKWLEIRKNKCIELLNAYMSEEKTSNLKGAEDENDLDFLNDEDLWDDPAEESWPDIDDDDPYGPFSFQDVILPSSSEKEMGEEEDDLEEENGWEEFRRLCDEE